MRNASTSGIDSASTVMAGSGVAQLLTYAGFAVAFVARPVGGAVFGHFGDRVGRKTMLIFSLLMMGLATFLIGVGVGIVLSNSTTRVVNISC